MRIGPSSLASCSAARRKCDRNNRAGESSGSPSAPWPIVTGGKGRTHAGECRIRMFARGSGTEGEVDRAGVRRVQRELCAVRAGHCRHQPVLFGEPLHERTEFVGILVELRVE